MSDFEGQYIANPPDLADGAVRKPILDIKGRLATSGATTSSAPASDAPGQVVRVAGRVLTDAGVWAYVMTATGLLSNTVDLATPARGMRVLADGDVKYETIGADGSTRYQFTETFVGANKEVVPLQIVRIYVTGTTVATDSIQIGV